MGVLSVLALVAAASTVSSAAAADAATLDVAWLRDGRVQAVRLHGGASATQSARGVDGAHRVPLGSLWKLFVYVYAVDTNLPTPDYPCTGRSQEETYCCDPGQSIGRDAALAQSCGLFFAPERLGLRTDAWRRYWSKRLGAPGADLAWLFDPAQLTPERVVRLDSLLRALDGIQPAARVDAENALLRTVLDGRGADTVRWFGSRLRVKTFSWHEPDRPSVRLGGAAGWLADGTPVWFAGAGTSATVFRTWAPRLAAALPPPHAGAETDAGCVVVDYFARYPVRSVTGPTGPAAPGPLNGRYAVRFENGQALAVRSSGELLLAVGADGRPQIGGRFGVNDYVARVLDREGAATPVEAARALAIAARSYLQQNGRPMASCMRIADSSATQRVSPNPPTAAALGIARWTDRLVIAGVPVRYHRDKAAPNVLAWTAAVAQDGAGRPFDAILADAYPGGVLSTGTAGAQTCRRLHDNEDWLARMLPRWERLLRTEAGYERPAQLPVVCELGTGAPYSEQSRNRVFMRPLSSREDRITLAHEYVHIGLRRHPLGQDEAWVERLARRLVDLNLETL